MVYVPVLNTLQVELMMRNLATNQRLENNLYFEGDAAWTIPGMVDVAQDLITWWVNECQPLLSNAFELANVKVTDLTTQTSPAIEENGGLPQIGTVAQPVLPGNVSLAVKFVTTMRGRSFRGRNFWPGFGETQVAADTVAPATIASIIAAYDAILSIAWTSTNNPTWVVVSRIANGVPRVAGVTTPVDHAAVADDTVDSQKRRLTGRGI